MERFAMDKPASWNRKVMLVVIHLRPTETYETAHREIGIAKQGGADGVFVIDMEGNLQGAALVELVSMLALDYPGYFIGINDLWAPDPSVTMHRIKGTKIAAIWSDKKGDRSLIETARDHTGCDVPLFGGVLFKHQPDFKAPDSKIPVIVQAALPYIEIITTSGKATGIAADNRRLALTREAAGPKAIICLSSGVTAQNVNASLPYVDIINASTSLVDFDDRLVLDRVIELRQAIDGYQPE